MSTTPTPGTGAGQEPAPQSGQEPQTPAAATGTPQAGTGTQGSPASADITPEAFAALQRSVTEANKEAAAARKKLKDRDEADEAARVAALSEAEKVTAERDALKAKEAEWQAERRKLLADAEARDLGTKLGLADYRDALALIPADQIEVDDTGKPKNLEQLFRALVAEKPYLAQKPGTAAPPSTGAAAGTSGGQAPRLTADELEAAKTGGIAPERYAAMKGVKTLADWQKAQPPKH